MAVSWYPQVHCVRAAAASSHKDLRLRGITEVLLARWEIFGEDSFGKQTFGFLFKDGGQDHDALALLLGDVQFTLTARVKGL